MVEIVSAPDKRFFVLNIAVHAVNSDSFVFAINGHSLVESLLILPQNLVGPLEGLVFALHNFNRVCIELFYRTHRPFGLVKILLPGVTRGLGPTDVTAEVVFGDYVFVSFKSEAHLRLSLVLSIVSSCLLIVSRFKNRLIEVVCFIDCTHYLLL